MSAFYTQPRILVVTPEVAFFPEGCRKACDYIATHSGGFADVLADLISDLFELGVDVHVVQPDYRKIFTNISQKKQWGTAKKIPADRVHLTEDRAFFYSNWPESNYQWENIKISLAFQREVMNHILPWVQPDLIHCHDWMTGLIPAVAKISGIQCIFTMQSFDTAKTPLSHVEDMGIDAAAFWQHLFYDRFPINYEETRGSNPLDFLLSGVYAAVTVNTDSSTRMASGVKGQQEFSNVTLKKALGIKWAIGWADIYDNYSLSTQQYIDIYQKLLQRDIINPKKRNLEFRGIHTHDKNKSNRSGRRKNKNSQYHDPAKDAA